MRLRAGKIEKCANRGGDFTVHLIDSTMRQYRARKRQETGKILPSLIAGVQTTSHSI